MISFRYHLVSIVSVFLALALGVLVGTTVVNQGVIDDLNNRVNSAVKRAEEARTQVGDLQQQVKEWGRFATAAEPLLVEGRLTGTEVVIVTQEGVDASNVERVRRTLQDAGGTVAAELVLTRQIALADQSSRSLLAAMVGRVETADPAGLAVEAARRLALRLTGGPASPGDRLPGTVSDRGVPDHQRRGHARGHRGHVPGRCPPDRWERRGGGEPCVVPPTAGGFAGRFRPARGGGGDHRNGFALRLPDRKSVV